MVEYILRSYNNDGGNFSNVFSNIKEAEHGVGVLKQANNFLPSWLKDKLSFHGWIERWEGYTLDDGSKVTVSCNAIKGFDF